MAPQEPENAVLAVAALELGDGTSVWFVASMSGLKRSVDHGDTWHDAYASLNPLAPITTLAIGVSPGFAADRYILSGAIDGVLMSDDAGRTWTALELPAPPPVITTFVFSPNFGHDGRVYAGTMEDGVYRSDDRGRSWAAWNFGLTDLSVLDLTISPRFASDGTLFAGTESGVFVSSNGGRSWRDVAFPMDAAPVISLATSPTYSIDHTLFAGTESSGLYRSNDEARSWVPTGGTDIDGALNAIAFSSKYALAPEMFALVDDRVAFSGDGGASWQDMVLEPKPEPRITSAAAVDQVGPNMNLLLGLEDGTSAVSQATVRTASN